VIDVGDHVVAVCRFHVQGQQSGVALDTPWIQVVDFRNGLPVSIRNFQDRTQALEAVGLRE
jgi:ketosteroid isomerase-like protein